MRIREATIADTDQIHSIYTEQFRFMAKLQPSFFQEGKQSKDFIINVIESDTSDILVCEDEGTVKGFALLQEKETPGFPFFIQQKFAYLMDIVITESCRENGFGSALLTEAKKWSEARNLSYLELDVLSNNSGALRFYEKHGFDEKRRTMFCAL